jgi:hypothetical protein
MNTTTRISRTHLLVGIAAVIVVAELFANVVDVGNHDTSSEGSVGGWLGLSAFGIAVTALLLLVVLPRISPARRRTAALVFGILAIVTVVAFWSALPFALGAAAIAAATDPEGEAAGDGGSLARAGSAFGSVAILVAFVLCIVG